MHRKEPHPFKYVVLCFIPVLKGVLVLDAITNGMIASNAPYRNLAHLVANKPR